MDDGGCLGYIIMGVIAIAIIGFIIYIAWGGGTAIANYAKSFKENMIDSNKVTA